MQKREKCEKNVKIAFFYPFFPPMVLLSHSHLLNPPIIPPLRGATEAPARGRRGTRGVQRNMIGYSDIIPIRNTSDKLEWISASKISKVYQNASGTMIIQLVGGYEVYTTLEEWSRVKVGIERMEVEGVQRA